MCDKPVDGSIATFKLIPDWFVTTEMIKKLFTSLYADKNILCFDEGSSNVVFDWKGMGILNIDFNKISLDDKFDEDDPDTNILSRLLAWHVKFVKFKELKKELSDELMSVVWHPDGWLDWCMSEVEKNEIGPMFIEEL